MSELIQVATIYTPFKEKFGIPRQSGLVTDVTAKIVFEPEFRNADWIKGIEEYSHLWVLWEFSLAKRENYSALVTPPRLGGKQKRGVFATRSPFRPNSIGLSSVCLQRVELTSEEGPILWVSGADILDGTPIYDIKPYLPYTDCHVDATGGFGQEHKDDRIEVHFPLELQNKLPEALVQQMTAVLAQDPRAAYNKKPDYVYGMAFDDYDVRFTVSTIGVEVKEVVSRNLTMEHIK